VNNIRILYYKKKRKQRYGIFIKTSISSSTYVENQKQAAEMLGIKNGSKKLYQRDVEF
jgi:hypothetical protein